MEANTATVTITHRGETVQAPADGWQGSADDMVKRLGAWVPGESKVEPNTPARPTEPGETAAAVFTHRLCRKTVPEPTPDPFVVAMVEQAPRDAAGVKATSEFGAGNQVHDAAAATRITNLHAALNAGGVKVDASRQLYDTGTRMAESGYAAQAARATEHAEKQPIRDAARELVERIKAERRKDVEVSASDLARGLNINGALTFDGLKVREQAIRGVLARMKSPALTYVLGLRDRMTSDDATPEHKTADRAELLDVLQHECRRFGDVKLKLRTREGLGDVFAIVSPDYTPADVPDVLPDVLRALPDDARASFSYDPTSTAWEIRASVFTPTPTDEQAVGEPFEGYVSFSSRDNGTRRLGGGGGILLIACLNASTYEAATTDVSRVHRGRILVDLHRMSEQATEAIHTLCKAWGTARADVLDVPHLVPLDEAIPGFFRHMLTARKGELVGVLPGRTSERVDGLTLAYFDQRRDTVQTVRGDLAQGFTRYVQDEAPAVRRDAERAIGRWLVSGERVEYAAA